ncbi:MAG: ATP-dependent RecD-like DNA helicase [Eubacteriales bacterium]|nr:ATP-dependent RecD-like DNA helicase [Eubacteriales bacterium]
MAEISGVVNSIIYRNTENGWTVLELAPDEGEKLTVVGALPLASVGERVELEGEYASHPKYGCQFKVVSYHTLAPATLSAIETYLGSGLIKGIGPATARAIVASFGMDTLRILDEDPLRLSEISGIGAKRRDMILASYTENRMMRDILLALEPYGITVNQAYKLYKIYGELCLTRIEENPYQIIQDVDGIGFVTADKIAQNVSGFSFDSESRLRAGLLYALSLAANEYGHTYLPRASLLNYASKLLGAEPERLGDSLDLLVERNEAVHQMVGETEAVFLPFFERMEFKIAEKLLRLSQKPIDNPFFDFAAIQSAQKLELSAQQRGAVLTALNEGALVITGGPGTGKTTIIRFITAIVEEMGLDVALTAPTGRAAKRMSDATGHDARTIHRLLEYVPGEGFLRNADDPLYSDMVIVDEMSMVDVSLMNALLKAIPVGTRLIMVGDADQLPSVGAGDVLRDIIASETVRVVRLDEIFRQAQSSMIITNAHRINSGSAPILDVPESDFVFEDFASQDRILDRIIDVCTHPDGVLATSEPLLDVQVLAPMKKGVLGVWNINTKLQAALNPPEPDKKEHISGDSLFREGDRVMQMKNNYKVEWKRRLPNGTSEDGTGAFNGDLGTVFQIHEQDRSMSIIFDDDRLAIFDFTQLDEIELAYCISIHKSQGSEFPVVILPMFGSASPMMTRNLLYTAVTRAKRQVVCIGRRDALISMVNNNRTDRRYTALCSRLTELKALGV